MKKIYDRKHSISGLVVTLLALIFMHNGCKDEITPSLFDESNKGVPTPVIDSITPADSGLAGVTEFSIAGSNFSSSKENVTVYFNATPGTIISTSPTSIIIRSANVVKDTVRVFVKVEGAFAYSNTKYIKLNAAVKDFDSLKSLEAPWAIATDTAGNMYVSIMSSGTGIGVKKFTPEGIRSDYAPKRFETKYSALRFSPAGVLYGVWGLQAFVQIPGGNINPVLWTSLQSTAKIFDFDFDTQGNIWAGGSNNVVRNARIYRIKPTKDTLSFPLNAVIRSIRVHDNYLYLAGKTYPDSAEKILRYPIIGDSLGAQEVYFNFSASSMNTGTNSIYSMAFTADGDLFVGTDRTESLLLIHPNGSVEEFYPGLISPTIHILTWGKGAELFGVRGAASAGSVGSSSTIIRINTQKIGAP